MKAIILAAGKGERLYPLTRNTPKCLLNISGEQCILGHLVHLFTGGGIDEIVVVVGFQADQVESYLASFSGVRITVVYNPFYSISNSIVSCWMARRHMNSDFLLINGDTVVHETVLATMLESGHTMCIGASRKTAYKEDDMKLILAEGEERLVRDVGRDIPVHKADGESIGFFKFAGNSCHEYTATIEKMFRNESNLHVFHHTVIRQLVRGGQKIHCLMFDRSLWEEIDLRIDLEQLRNNVNLSLFKG